MAQRIANNPVVIQTYIATAAVTKYSACIAGTNADEVTVPSAAGDLPVGVCMNGAGIGEPVDVCMFGPYLCRADAAIARGSVVRIANAAGDVDDITITDEGTVTHSLGVALEAAADADDLISVFVGYNPYSCIA